MIFVCFVLQVERHPNIVHLPAPHIWQLTPSSVHTNSTSTTSMHSNGFKGGEKGKGDGTLVVSMQLHVREDLGDDEILKLTRWTWERVVRALGSSGGGGGVNGMNNHHDHKVGMGNGHGNENENGYGCGGDVWKAGLGLGDDVGVEVTVGVVKG